MNPADAAERGLANGSLVKVWNDLGEVYLPLRITAAVRSGVVSSEKGAWAPDEPERADGYRLWLLRTKPTSPTAPATTIRAWKWPRSN